MGKQNNLFESLQIKDGRIVLRNEEDIDMLFQELEKRRHPIANNLDTIIRMSIQKLKLQKYYAAKLKDYRKWLVETPAPKASISNAGTISKAQIKKLSKAERKRIREEKRKIVREKVNKVLSATLYYFYTFKTVDSVVNYLKEHREEFDVVIESWIRKSISGNELVEYYKERMGREFDNYRAIENQLLNNDSVLNNVKYKSRLENFRRDLFKYIESHRNGNSPKSKKKEKQTSSFDALHAKPWILDWNCVMFKQGHAIIYSRSDMPVKFKPKNIQIPGSLESFNYLRNYLNERLEPVRCSIVREKLTIVDNINFGKAIQQFAAAARQGLIKTGGRGRKTIGAPSPMSFSQAISKAKSMTPEEFKKYKSKYIDYLVELQCEDYKVIPCVERLSHANSDITEYAFMFSIKCRYSNILIVHENVNPDRSTLLFWVKEKAYDSAIREIYDFLQSAEINKRSSLREGGIEVGNAGVVRYKSINHDDIWSWRDNIRFYANGYYINI